MFLYIFTLPHGKVCGCYLSLFFLSPPPNCVTIEWQVVN